jgi:Ion channel
MTALAVNEKDHRRHRSRIRRRARTLWANDSSMTLLLVLLLGNIFLLPLARFETWGRFGARMALSVMLISGLAATVIDRWMIAAAIAFVIGGLLVGLEDIAQPNLYLHLINDMVSLLSLAFLIALIFRQVFRSGPITLRRIEGSVALYLLLGFLWTVAYGTIALLAPHSFSFGPAASGGDLSDLGYFSFTTLTTLGLGDVLPLTAPARSLVIVEALIGQLFPVILIARLVSLEVEDRRSRENLKSEEP